MGEYKKAIFDYKDQEKLLKVCRSDTEFIVIWMFLNTGIHPKDLGKLTMKNIKDDEDISWKRVKNKKPRRETLPNDIMEKLKSFLRNKRRPKSRIAHYYIVRDVGRRIGFKGIISPMSLRHTFCINLLREYGTHPQAIDFVAKRMGCSRETVIQNYIDLQQWERIGKK